MIEIDLKDKTMLKIKFKDGTTKEFESLKGADLRGADLEEACLEGADLRKATVAAQIGEAYPPGMMEVLDIFKEYLHQVALGMKPVDPARSSAQEEIDSIQ